MKSGMSLIVALSLMIGAGLLLHHRVQEYFSLNRNLAMDVYFPSDACVNALDYTDKLNIDAYHFLLISNCFHSESFQEAKVLWRFDHILPSFIYDRTSGDQGQFFQTWLQKPTGRIENIPDSRFQTLRLFEQNTDRKQIEAMHFLCAHTELLAQHPKIEPKLSRVQNYQSLFSTCLNNRRHPHTQFLPSKFIEGSTGSQLLELFKKADPKLVDFETLVQSR